MPEPMSLLLARTPLPRKNHVKILSAAELADELHDVIRIRIPSGEDVVNLFRRHTGADLPLLKMSLTDEPRADRSNPLIGTTFMLEARDVANRSFRSLQAVAYEHQSRSIDAFVKLEREMGGYASRRSVTMALEGGWPPPGEADKLADTPMPALESASLLHPLLRLAETAVAQNDSLIFRYEEIPPPRKSSVLGFLSAQGRPLLVACVAALLFAGIGLFQGEWSGSEAIAVALRVGFGFLLPFWLAQIALFLYARRKNIYVEFIPGGRAAALPSERLRLFLFTLQPRTFPLGALYQPPPLVVRRLPRPTLLYLALFLFGLGLFFFFLFRLPLSPAQGQFFTAVWLSSLLFGLSHLVADR